MDGGWDAEAGCCCCCYSIVGLVVKVEKFGNFAIPQTLYLKQFLKRRSGHGSTLSRCNTSDVKYTSESQVSEHSRESTIDRSLWYLATNKNTREEKQKSSHHHLWFPGCFDFQRATTSVLWFTPLSLCERQWQPQVMQ